MLTKSGIALVLLALFIGKGCCDSEFTKTVTGQAAYPDCEKPFKSVSPFSPTRLESSQAGRYAVFSGWRRPRSRSTAAAAFRGVRSGILLRV